MSASPLPDVHLDLGCGKQPRNAYRRGRLCGVDIRPLASTDGFEYRVANLSVAPIPWEDDTFGSISAFDFIEHVPRILPTPDGSGTFFPFVRLMDEVWRVLAPGGLFYAVTPALPNPEAFVDPTHVNYITERTHEYFCGDNPLGRMYGFRGSFAVRRTAWVHCQDAYDANAPQRPSVGPLRRYAHAVRDGLRVVRGRPVALDSRRRIYFLWELEAIKPGKTPTR